MQIIHTKTKYSLYYFVFILIENCFAKEDSAATVGTSDASMNRNGKTNAKKGPEKEYNAFKELQIGSQRRILFQSG